MELTDNMRKLIGDLEYIIASCTKNQQKRGSFDYRYPVSFNHDGKTLEYKGKNKFYMPDESDINNMRYEMGTNHLYIGQALTKVLDYLEKRYDICFDDLEAFVEQEEDDDSLI